MDRRTSRRSYGRSNSRYEKSWKEKCKDYLRQFIAFMFTNVGIIGLVVAYTIAGAFMFIAIEGKSNLSILSPPLFLFAPINRCLPLFRQEKRENPLFRTLRLLEITPQKTCGMPPAVESTCSVRQPGEITCQLN